MAKTDDTFQNTDQDDIDLPTNKPLENDFDTPAAPPDETDEDKILRNHPQADSNVDSGELYDAGYAGATGFSAQHVDSDDEEGVENRIG